MVSIATIKISVIIYDENKKLSFYQKSFKLLITYFPKLNYFSKDSYKIYQRSYTIDFIWSDNMSPCNFETYSYLLEACGANNLLGVYDGS